MYYVLYVVYNATLLRRRRNNVLYSTSDSVTVRQVVCPNLNPGRRVVRPNSIRAFGFLPNHESGKLRRFSTVDKKLLRHQSFSSCTFTPHPLRAHRRTWALGLSFLVRTLLVLFTMATKKGRGKRARVTHPAPDADEMPALMRMRRLRSKSGWLHLNGRPAFRSA